MAKVVWKETLDATDRQTIHLPSEARILHVAVQYGKPCIWFLCNPQFDRVSRTFRIVGTGHEINADLSRNYLGSFMLHAGALVFHVFEET